MPDIDADHRATLGSFAGYQWLLNPAGIGNECTHWVYASLFEARALDRDVAHRPRIAQAGIPYTWGRAVRANGVQTCDIAQFHNYQNQFAIYLANPGAGWAWLTSHQVRGPNHTGIVLIPPRQGVYYQLESHLHQPGAAVMRIRGSSIYFESFAVALSAADLGRIRGGVAWPSDVDAADARDMIERVDWAGLRATNAIDLMLAESIGARIRRGGSPTGAQTRGRDVSCLFVVRAMGHHAFYCPQASSARLAMNDAQLADEKRRVIDMMIRSGRRGGSPTEDEFGGDNKRERLHDHRFDWSLQTGWSTVTSELQQLMQMKLPAIARGS